MSDYVIPARAATRDGLSAQEFLDELRRVAKFDRPAIVEHPIAAVVEQIRQNPAFAQSRLLARMLEALTYDRGLFRRAELSTFDTATRGTVIALMDVSRAGTAKRSEWVEAVDAAGAALTAAGG